METDFTVDIDEIEKIYDFNFEFEELINMDCSVYRIKLTRKTQIETSRTNEVVLYFLTSKFRKLEAGGTDYYYANTSKICKKPIHILPFLLLYRLYFV